MASTLMRRYYFDLVDDNGVSVTDDEGLECRDIRAVQAEAARALADMARDAVHAASDSPTHHLLIDVRDDDGPVMQVRFVFEIRKRRPME